MAGKTFRAKNAKSDIVPDACLPQSCSEGRGDQYIEHGDYTWRTLDGADLEGNYDGAPNDGCQCTGSGLGSRSCPDTHLPLPAGWVLAPNDATSIDYESDCFPRRYVDGAWQDATDNWPECSGSTSRAVAAAHGWSTSCAVLADGTAWGSANSQGAGPGGNCTSYCPNNNCLATSGGNYTVTACRIRVLVRCG
eukprot:COSAG04_NODE_8978_length_910_cov_2.040691_1_plen_193_part_00